jgi:hypothetical protein
VDAENTPQRGEVQDETRAAEGREADVRGRADRPPTPDEEAVAERVAADVPDEVAEHYEEMIERGAGVRGEGQIEPEGAQTP